MFSAQELQERESKPFDYLFQGSVGSSVIESYSLAGAVLTNFFNKAGVTGMKQLFAQLKNMDSAQLSDTADSDKIVNTMAGVSGLTGDSMLSPFKTSNSFAADAAAITHADYGSVGDDAVVDYIKTQVPDYVGGQGASVVSGAIATAATVAPSLATAAASTTGCPALSRTLSLGSKGNDVTALQQYLIRIGVLNSAPSGYFGKLTQKAVMQWQSASNISATGSVGPKTRAALAQRCAAH